MGSFLNLFLAASMPVLDVLLITIIGLFLALKNIDILGENARHHLNTLVFYIFNPALVTSNLAKTITFQSFLTLWFMPINILITFVVGSILGWLLGKVTRAPRHINGLILASCSAGNLGSLVLIIVPAICKEKGSPFGAPDICKTHGLGYASLSMAIGMIYLWLYVYNILRISSKEVNVNTGSETNGYGTKKEPSDETSVNVTETECDLSSLETRVVASPNSHSHSSSSKFEVALSYKIERCLRSTSKRMKLKELLAPSTIGAIVGFFIGMISPFRKLLIGDDAPLHVVGDTVSMLAYVIYQHLTSINIAHVTNSENYLQSYNIEPTRPKVKPIVIGTKLVLLLLTHSLNEGPLGLKCGCSTNSSYQALNNSTYKRGGGESNAESLDNLVP